MVDLIQWIAILLLGLMTYIQHKYLNFVMGALIDTNEVLLHTVDTVNAMIDDIYITDGGGSDGEHE